MRLQRLEISGFKSFPDRAELHFDRGVTAIVGPNGCGKSNVVDAITWVLGEQSVKSLRGDRMEDVIFSGSDARKPTAAAEVRLRLAGVPAGPNGSGPSSGNGNGHAVADVLAALDEVPLIARDIEVARRLYRSGESEYLIDGEVCRLRDVHDLLMDAGLGLKGYAVIEQGKIGQILSARPTDRRQLIEEAAGVTKYKTRKRAAELKLEAAQQNLARVDDIIHEVQKQHGALRRQAARARRYRRLRDEQRRWEKVLFARRYQTWTDAMAIARTRLAAARSAEAQAVGRLQELEAHLERLRHALAGAEAGAAATREAVHAQQIEIERRQQQVEFDRQQLSGLSTVRAEIAAEIAELACRREPSRIELTNATEALARAEDARGRATETLSAEEASYGEAQRRIHALEAEVEACRTEIFAAANTATTLKHVIENAVVARERLAQEIGKLEAEASDLRREADRASADRDTASEALRTMEESLEATRAARQARETELASARIDRQWRTQEARGREQNLAGLRARLQSLEELDAARGAYADGARLVLAESNGDIDHRGSVADYLEVDRPYERAIEACLADLLQHVIVPTHAQAAAGLDFVRSRQAGRCGFLVVDSGVPAPDTGGTRLEPDEDSGGTRLQPGSGLAPTDVASEGLLALGSVVRIHGPWALAIREAMGEAWIAESFADAKRLAGRTSSPVVTLGGEVLRGTRLVEGGTGGTHGILGIKGEIKELRGRIADGSEALRALAAEIDGFDTLIQLAENSLAALQLEQHRQEKLIVGYELQLARARDEAERVARKQEVVALERRRAEEERRSLDARSSEAHESIARIEEERRRADERFLDAQARLHEAREGLQDSARRLAEAKADSAALAERAVALAAELQRLERQAGDLEVRITGRSEELERAELRLAGLHQAVSDGEQALERLRREHEAMIETMQAASLTLASQRSEVEIREASIKEARAALEDVRSHVARMDVARATLEADLAHLAESCFEITELTLDQVAVEAAGLEEAHSAATCAEAAVAGEEEEAEEDAEGRGEPPPESPATLDDEPPDSAALSAEEMVARLRKQIERLGPVNMMAIEQFDELETRHAFLTGQRQDLLDSIAATGEAIRRIEKTTRERFADAYNTINAYFQEAFATLFGGGRAGLSMLDEDDLLESGIDIIAQPPGKRLQNVQLLSGGEKALTAMALMFAIFRYRPSPFCLLDEIDAPLDDANIGRFVEMLKSMQDQTQFILITHNRKTMEIADRLYGVTMEEPGVSKLISVRLSAN